MPAAEEIAHQQTLLTTYRRNLMHYLSQQAKLGDAYAPPAIAHGIIEARNNIQRIKQILRDWNISIEDLPDDGDTIVFSTVIEPPKVPPATVDRIRLRQILIEYFSEEELRDIAFDMMIDYEVLAATGKAGKARELIAYSERHRKFQDLVQLVQLLRPSISW